MNRIDWLLSNVKEPEGSGDFYHLYDDFNAVFEAVSMETFKRYARQARREYAVSLEEYPEVENTLKDKEVILDQLSETNNKLELSLKSYKI